MNLNKTMYAVSIQKRENIRVEFHHHHSRCRLVMKWLMPLVCTQLKNRILFIFNIIFFLFLLPKNSAVDEQFMSAKAHFLFNYKIPYIIRIVLLFPQWCWNYIVFTTLLSLTHLICVYFNLLQILYLLMFAFTFVLMLSLSHHTLVRSRTHKHVHIQQK